MTRPQAWYNDERSPARLHPISVVVAAWQLLSALLMLAALLVSRSLRAPRSALITVHLVLLLALSGAFVKLPLVYRNRMLNPFTWRPDAVFCRFHVVTIQYIVSALPLVVLTIAIDCVVWARHPVYYRSKMAPLPGRLLAVCAPWLVAAVVTLGVVLYTMPSGGHLVSGRCIPAFNAKRIVVFLVLVLLGRFFLPLIAVIICVVLLFATTRRHIRGLTPGSPPGERRRWLVHACVSVSVLCGLYVFMVGPHYAQIVLLRIPGAAGGMNYNRLAQVGFIVLALHEAFWNLLPLIWALLQVDLVLGVSRKCCCPANSPEEVAVDGAELEMLTGLDSEKAPTE